MRSELSLAISVLQNFVLKSKTQRHQLVLIGLADVVFFQRFFDIAQYFDKFLMIDVHAGMGIVHVLTGIVFRATTDRAQQFGNEFDQVFVAFRRVYKL